MTEDEDGRAALTLDLDARMNHRNPKLTPGLSSTIRDAIQDVTNDLPSLAGFMRELAGRRTGRTKREG
jgi:hypothetical protein